MSQGLLRNKAPRSPPVAASFRRMMPRAGMTGPGQRHTGNN
jgi:hypothetical protein